MESTEIQAYKAQKSGLPIFKYDKEQKEIAFTLLFDKIKFISGVSMGAGDLFETAQEEIYKFIMSVPAFKMLTIEEVVTAFRMNASGQMGERVEHYQSFITCDYVGKILEKYIKVRQSIEDKMLYAVIPETHQIAQPIFNEDEFIKAVKNIYSSTRMVGLITDKAYDIFTAKGLLKLSDKEKDAIKSKVISDMESEAMVGGVNEMRKLRELKSNKSKFDFEVRIASRRLAVAQYLDKQQNTITHETSTNNQ